MRQLLRRAFAIAIILSVLSSTLGVVHGACAAMTSALAQAPAAQHAAGHDHGTPSGERDAREHHSPAERDGGTTACALVIHCSTMLPAVNGAVSFAASPAGVRRPPTDETGPLDPALEHESPPPRG